ncbi:MAG: ABC transporter permease [Verrucomicrobiae bacterium]|nr:ABC transporter permease [Verrucomicrobiae bacterium]
MGALWTLFWGALCTGRRVPWLLALLFLQPVFAWFSIPDQREGALLEWTANLYLGLMIPIYCLMTGGGLIRDETQAGTLGYLLTRPVSRARIFLGKYLCQLFWGEIILGANSLFLVVVAYVRGVESWLSIAPVLLLTQLFVVPAFLAISALLGLISRRYVVLGVVYGFLVEVGIGQIPTNINVLSVSRHARTLMANSTAFADRFGWEAEGTLWSVASLLIITAVFLVLGTIWFTLREFSGPEEEKK